MQRKYKIYIKDRAVYLVEWKRPFTVSKSERQVELYPCHSKSEMKKIITALEIGSIRDHLVIAGEDLQKLKSDFFGNFKLVVAGGGLVRDADGRWLIIHRKKHWDLPKGKIEKGEDVLEGSVREVEEETGVQVTNVVQKLGKTYHTYKLKNKRVLKETHWYLMDGEGTDLVPQEGEGIDQALWLPRKEAKARLKASYASLQEVLDMEKAYRELARVKKV